MQVVKRWRTIRMRKAGIEVWAPTVDTRLSRIPSPLAGRAALEAMVTRQAPVIAYIDDCKCLLIATLAVLPPVLVHNSACPSCETAP